jgi:DNA processing protein
MTIYQLTDEAPSWPVRLGSVCQDIWVNSKDVDLAAMVSRSVAVVGARAATAYGEHVAFQTGYELAQAGITVISGGAFGIDAAALRGALSADGSCVIVHAAGLDRPYPTAHTGLFDQVVDQGGAVVSQYPPRTAPSRHHFLARNRVIATLCNGIVVVEAAYRSGALNAAHQARELTVPVMAYPGPVTSMMSAGVHKLIKDGEAVLVTDVADIIGYAGLGGVLHG